MSEIENVQQEGDVSSQSSGKNEQEEGDARLQYSESSSDEPIMKRWQLKRKKRKRAYLDFGEVTKVFPDVTTDVACQLADMSVIKPSNVLKQVPEATLAQIAAFLRIAEKDAESTTEVAAPERSLTPKLGQGLSQLKQLKKMALAGMKKSRQLDSPTQEDSQFMERLKKLVPPMDGGNGSLSVDFSEKFQEKILSLLGSTNSSKEFNSEHCEKIFEKLVGDPLARSRIENLHAARAHKYGHAHFGPKYWYKESLNLAKKWRSQDDRRKFRAGLKGLVDFLNQLNIMDLEKLLNNGEPEGFNLLKIPGPMSPETFCSCLKSTPPIKMIEFINKRKATDILELVGKISSLAHFSQSMADYFARDDALEPALAVVCEVLRTNQDVGGVLEKRAATFMSLAQPYDKHRSAADRDATGRKNTGKYATAGPSARRRGLCFAFQTNDCKSRNCTYKHECRRCGSSSHGEMRCDNKRRRKSKSRDNKE